MNSSVEVVDVIVIGRGMFGSAAARHIAETGRTVVAVGPQSSEADQQAAGGPSHRVYSSHDDEARLTRFQDRDEQWAAITAEALNGYNSIETASGIIFHHPVGCLIASRPGGDGRNADPVEYLQDHNIEHEYFEPGDARWRDRWPALAFPETHAVAYEPGPAGFIRPKRLIAAQETLAGQHGAVMVNDTVTAVRRSHEAGGFEVAAAHGQRFRSQQVVIAAGAFTNFNGLTNEPVDIRLKSEVIILAEVNAADAEELSQYPTVKYLNDGDDLEAIYMTPPLVYPDGKHYIKMGANTRLDQTLTNVGEVQNWFESSTDDAYLPLLQLAIEALWPTTSFVAFRTRPCVITYTPERFPTIAEVEPGVIVATGGNGGGAKGADRWGALAAECVVRSGHF